MVRSLFQLVFTFMIFSMFQLCAQDKTDTQKDKLAIKQLIDDYVTAFNKHDPKAMASLWAEDGDLISPWGQLATSDSDVEKVFAANMEGILKKAHVEESVEFIRFIKPDLALVDVDRVITNMVDENGQPTDPFSSHGFYVMIKKDNKWRVLSFRIYILLGPIKSI